MGHSLWANFMFLSFLKTDVNTYFIHPLRFAFQFISFWKEWCVILHCLVRIDKICFIKMQQSINWKNIFNKYLCLFRRWGVVAFAQVIILYFDNKSGKGFDVCIVPDTTIFSCRFTDNCRQCSDFYGFRVFLLFMWSTFFYVYLGSKKISIS